MVALEPRVAEAIAQMLEDFAEVVDVDDDRFWEPSYKLRTRARLLDDLREFAFVLRTGQAPSVLV